MKKEKPHIHHIYIKPHSPEWHQFRYDHGIGGSESSSILATVSKTIAELTYTPPIKWYLGKIGEPVQEFTGNVESRSGHFFEPIILNYYKHYDMDVPSQMDMFDNIEAKRRINRVISPKVYIVNDKYPWLFYSPDAFAWPKYGKTKILVECKNTTSMTARRFVNKVDPAFYCQVQQGLLLCELEEAVLCILVDGRWFEPITIKADPEVQQLIIDTSYKMWRNVLEARKIKLQYEIPTYYGMNPQHIKPEWEAAIHTLGGLEPSLINTEDELKFIREMVKPSEDDVEMKGLPEQLELCIEYHKIGDAQDEWKQKKEAVCEKLLLSLGKGFNKAVFEDGSYFSYKNDSRGIAKMYVSDKMIKPTQLNP